MEFVDIRNDFYTVKFDLCVGRGRIEKKIINKCPWMIFCHNLAIWPWASNFMSSDIVINSMEYYDESVLLALITTIGEKVWFWNHWLNVQYEKLHLMLEMWDVWYVVRDSPLAKGEASTMEEIISTTSVDQEVVATK
ncbi:hypothetical protein CR513_06497, partial [Mucuna pruriens]